MTPDERIEALLNRAGQTIYDLPKGDGQHLVYSKELRKSADTAQMKWHGIRTDSLIDVVDGLNMTLDYILHLTDIIDRMETALENVCGERDCLAKRLCKVACDCQLCIHSLKRPHEEPCISCRVDDCSFEFAAIPEDWRVDNETD